MKKYLIVLGLAGFAAMSTASAAAENSLHAINNGSVTINAGLGWLGGESKETVYDPASNYKMSQLNWKIKNTPIIKGDISWDVLDWLTFNARGWSSLTSHHSDMNDYDWMDEQQSGWTDWSAHPDTHLNYANEFDLNLKGWLLNQQDYRLGVVAGYQQTRFSWTAKGGHYQYDNQHYVGDFPQGQSVTGYQQKFSFPYLGIAGRYQYRNFEFGSLLKFSPWVQARDNDEHYLRNITFRDNAKNTRYYSASVDAGYYITTNTKIFTEFSWSRFSEGKGAMELIDHDSGKNSTFGGESAGIENNNYTISAGIQYRF